MKTVVESAWENARSQAQAQFESIREMVEALRAAGAVEGVEVDEKALEDAERAIHEDALSVEVRSDWCVPGQFTGRVKGIGVLQPVEYRILLCTGGPAVRITGNLSGHCEPETARLEMQDWFSPWTEYRPTDKDAEEILLVYARQFYFGE